jgi:hypothetical protein
VIPRRPHINSRGDYMLLTVLVFHSLLETALKTGTEGIEIDGVGRVRGLTKARGCCVLTF